MDKTVDETSFPEIDWSDNADSNLSDTENTNDDELIIVSPESDPSFDCNRDQTWKKYMPFWTPETMYPNPSAKTRD